MNDVPTTTILIGIALLALMNAGFKALGPAVLRDRTLSPAADRVLRAIGPGLLASLIVVTLLGADWAGFDATILPGLAVAVALRLAGQSQLVCALMAVVVTGLIRLVV